MLNKLKNIELYSYQKCSTCIKASKWLDQKNIKYKIIDIVKNPPSKRLLELALIQFLAERKKIFNTRGKSFKLINYDIKDLSNEKIIQLLANDGKLIKRPFLVIENSIFILGFNETEYANYFK